MLTAKKIQVLLLCILAALFCAPAIISTCLSIAPDEEWVKAAQGQPLYGVTQKEISKPFLTQQTWSEGDFARNADLWFGQNFSGRNLMVRLNNELNYDLFRKSTIGIGDKNLIVGKDDCLFEAHYLDNDCNVKPAMPVERLQHIVRQMAQMQDRLAKRGVPFVVMVTPDKSLVYPEYIPYQYRVRETGAPTNYDNLVALLNRYSVTYSDGLQLMKKIQRTEKTPLFCQGGIHWTSYGAFREAQSLEELLNTRGLDLSPMHCDGVTWTQFTDGPIGGVDNQDYDLAQMLNTCKLPIAYRVPQPIVHTDSPATPTKTLVVVGGSFCWKPIWLYDREKIFKQIRFYFYYHNSRSTFPHKSSSDASEPVDTARIDWSHDIFGADAVVLEINVAILNQGIDEHYTAFLNDGLQHIDADGNCH